MAASFYRKVGDREPPLAATLRDGANVAVDLTDCSVKFLLRRRRGLPALIDASATIVSVDGEVQYEWTANDAALPAGVYQGEFERTGSNGKVSTFPNDGYIAVILTDQVG